MPAVMGPSGLPRRPPRLRLLALSGIVAAGLACATLPASGPRDDAAQDTVSTAPAATAAPPTRDPAPPPVPPPVGLELLGVLAFPTGLAVDGLEVGGLSGISCEPATGHCWAISDDRGTHGPARFVTLDVDLGDGSLDAGDVVFTGSVALTGPDGRAFPEGALDPEGIARDAAGDLWISSEGDTHQGIAPWVRRFSADGRQLEELPLPAGFLPDDTGARGVRFNEGFEPLALADGGVSLWTGTENALAQDGPEADLGIASPARLLRFDLTRRRVDRQLLYWVDAVDSHRPTAGDFRVSGLVELLALPNGGLVSMERAYVAGLGNRIRLYQLDLGAADDLEATDPEAAGVDPVAVTPVTKRLLADLAQFGIDPDNVEGASLGPLHPDGRPTLVLVSDNNFSPLQQTQVIAFALELDALGGPEPDPLFDLPVSSIQGAAHRSPVEGRRVAGVEGVVTRLRETPGDAGFWLQSRREDGDPATSEAVFVATGYRPPGVAPGQLVTVVGRVAEHGAAGELPETRITTPQVKVLESGLPLPPAVTVGVAGRRPPLVNFDDDGLTSFEPETDGLDFWESLEGMRVVVPAARVVGPTTSWGELVVVSDDAGASATRTAAGGLLATAGDFHPERLVVDAGRGAAGHPARVGDRFAGPLEGILVQGRGGYRLLPDGELPELEGAGPEPGRTTLVRAPGHLTVATYNLYNLAASDDAETFERHARLIVERLGSPELLGLQEVQDANGPLDDGTVDGRPTLERLVRAIVEAGGPRYDYRQIDPVDGQDGGQPGANIRVALLLDPAVVRFVDRGEAGPLTAAEVVAGSAGPRLATSPVRVGAGLPAFARDPGVGFGGSRKPLAAEIEAGGRRLFVVVAHLASKGGDDPLFGDRQPPVPRSEVQRRDQAAAIVELVAQLRIADPAAGVIVLGDLNELPFRPPVERLRSVLVDAVAATVPLEERYTFVYRGNGQQIDHVLVSPSLARGAEAAIVHGNADFPAAGRASDHDPVVVRLRMDTR